MSNSNVVIITDNPRNKLFEILEKYFKLLTPLTISTGTEVNIRFSMDEWFALSEDERFDIRRLTMLSDHDLANGVLEGIELEWFQKYNYWARTKEMLFELEYKNAICVGCRCKYCPDGQIDGFDILILDKDVPKIVAEKLISEAKRVRSIIYFWWK
jgi:hypothetical protein